MSPRAVWQLEAMGFSDVYDFVDGKIEWLGHGLPTEGKGPHHAVVGDVANSPPELVAKCKEGVGDRR